MEQRECGRSGLTLSVLGLGCWFFGGGEGPCEQSDVDTVVRRAFEVGITYFDTAEVYNDRRSETSLGRALRGCLAARVINEFDHPSSLLGLEFVQHAAHECAQLRSRHGLEGPDERNRCRPIEQTAFQVRRRTMDSNPPSLKLPRAGPATHCAQGKLGRAL